MGRHTQAVPTGHELADELGARERWTTKFTSKNHVRFQVEARGGSRIDLSDIDVLEPFDVQQWPERHDIMNVAVSYSEYDRLMGDD